MAVSNRGGSTSVAQWFGPPDRRLFGWVHLPLDGRAQGAVVLCSPLAREETNAHAPYRLLAEQLADRGLVAIRFDYDGAGDSAGSHHDPRRLERWLSSVHHAVALARSTGVTRVSLVGMRLGATLAAAVAEQLGTVDSLVLWDPCWSGRTFIRQQRAISILRFGGDGPGAAPGELPGFRFDAPAVRDLVKLRLPTQGVRAARRVLVLGRPGTTAPGWADAGLASSPIAWETAADQADLLDVEPGLSQMPSASIDRITDWLGEPSGRGECAVELRPSSGSNQTAMSTADGHTVVERCVRLGPHGLFGIATSPVGATSAPTVLMSNVSTERHVGPSRMWVDLSRQLAARGVPSVRFDLSGLGDSPTRPGRSTQLVYSPDAFNDLEDVMRGVSPDDPRNVVLVGHCSGAYSSLEGALAQRVRGVCAINPIIRFTPPEMDEGPMDPRRRICRPVGPAVLAYRGIPFPSLRRSLRSSAWHIANVVAGSSAPSHWVAELVASGVDTFCIGGEDELRPIVHGGRRTQLSLAATGRCRFEVVPGLDHALLYSPQRQKVAVAVLEHLTDRFAPEPLSASTPETDPVSVLTARPGLTKLLLPWAIPAPSPTGGRQ